MGFYSQDRETLLSTPRGRSLTAPHEIATAVKRVAANDGESDPPGMHNLFEGWANGRGKAARMMLDWSEWAIGSDDAIAGDILQQLRGAYPEWCEPAARLASLSFFQDSLADCRRHAELAVSLNPQRFDVWHTLALCEMEACNWQAASSAAQQALDINPEFNPADAILRTATSQMA